MPRTLLIISIIALISGASAKPPAAVSACEDAIVSTATVAPKLDVRFFHTTETSFHWSIIEDESGDLEDTSDGSIDADDLVRIEHTANCVSSHQGEHVMSYCEAVATADGAVLEFSGGMPAYASTLSITIGPKMNYKCSFAATYPAQTNLLKWKITKKEFKLKRAELASGSRLFGWLSISFDEIDSVANVTKSYKIEGHFKPVLQHKKP